MKKFIVFFAATVSLVWAGAFSSRVTLFTPSLLNGVELKPGEYRIEVEDGNLIMRSGKTTAKAAVKTETGENKFDNTSVRYSNGDGKYRITEIRIGGTNTKLIVN
jgi:hypothetical protein